MAKRLGSLLAVAASLAAWRCAHMEAPSGGPVDTKAPAVVAVFPAPGSRNVALDAPVVLQYSEWIHRDAARSKVFVSPPARGRLRVAVEGNKMQVMPSEAAGGWRANTAYQVTVLPSLRDLHEIPAGKPFVLRFSTGATVDIASLAGRVTSADPKGTRMAALYRTGDRAGVEALSTRAVDFKPAAAPEPWSELPAFLALADSTGAFRFDSVAQGDYAVLAFEDVNGNFAFDLGFENAAIGALSLGLRPRGEDQVLRTAPTDTVPLRVIKADFEADSVANTTTDSARVAGKIRIEFSRPPHPARAVEAARYRIVPVVPAEGEAAYLSVLSANWSALDGAWMLEAPPLRAGRDYRVETLRRPDYAGRDTAARADTSVSFTVGSGVDTTDWKLSFARTSALTRLPRASGAVAAAGVYTVASSRPLSPARWKLLTERLEVRVDTVPAPHELSFVNLFTFSFKLSAVPAGGKRLDLRLRPVPGDSAPRSLVSLVLADSTTLGTVRFTPPDRWAGWMFRLDENNAEGASYPAPAASIPAGKYRLSAFRDADGDSVWNPGSLKPWIPQEPHVLALDSVEVKPGAVLDLTERLKSRK